MMTFRFSLPYKHAIKSGKLIGITLIENWWPELIRAIRTEGPLLPRRRNQGQYPQAGGLETPLKRRWDSCSWKVILMVKTFVAFKKNYDLNRASFPLYPPTNHAEYGRICHAHRSINYLRCHGLITEERPLTFYARNYSAAYASEALVTTFSARPC